MNQGKFNWPFFLKAIAVIAIPVALQNLLTTTGSMVDTMMLAKLGKLRWVPLAYVPSFRVCFLADTGGL